LLEPLELLQNLNEPPTLTQELDCGINKMQIGRLRESSVMWGF